VFGCKSSSSSSAVPGGRRRALAPRGRGDVRVAGEAPHPIPLGALSPCASGLELSLDICRSSLFTGKPENHSQTPLPSERP
jgi:hypothetical protein